MSDSLPSHGTVACQDPVCGILHTLTMISAHENCSDKSGEANLMLCQDQNIETFSPSFGFHALIPNGIFFKASSPKIETTTQCQIGNRKKQQVSENYKAASQSSVTTSLESIVPLSHPLALLFSLTQSNNLYSAHLS